MVPALIFGGGIAAALAAYNMQKDTDKALWNFGRINTTKNIFKNST